MARNGEGFLTIRFISQATLGAAAALLLAAACGSAAQPDAVSKPAPPFARVYLATRGCTSCSHCRTNIRQMLRPAAKGGEMRIGGDQVDVIYPKPQAVPLRDVIQSLAGNRLHDLSLVDVLFEAGGVIQVTRDGAATLRIAETGQAFPLAIDPPTVRPPDGAVVRVTALVEGWRDKGALSLRVRELHAI
jgi:hypothetical protein